MIPFVVVRDELAPGRPEERVAVMDEDPDVSQASVRGGPRNSDSLLRWDPDPGKGVWHATEETELSC